MCQLHLWVEEKSSRPRVVRDVMADGLRALDAHVFFVVDAHGDREHPRRHAEDVGRRRGLVMSGHGIGFAYEKKVEY